MKAMGQVGQVKFKTQITDDLKNTLGKRTVFKGVFPSFHSCALLILIADHGLWRLISEPVDGNFFARVELPQNKPLQGGWKTQGLQF